MSSMQQTVPDPQNHAREATSYQPLMIVLVAVCVGIFLDRKTGIPAAAWVLTAAGGWGIWLILWRTRRDGWAGAVLLVAVAAAGGGWHHMTWSLFDKDDLGWYALDYAGPVCVEAVALTGPRRVPAPPSDPMRPFPVGDRTRLDVRIERLRDRARWLPVVGRASLSVDGHLLGVRAGDRLRIFGRLTSPSPPRNPGGFDYLAQRRADRQLSSLWASYPDCVSIVRRGGPLTPKRWIEDSRTAGDKLLWQFLDHRRAGLAAAVLLGAREEIDPDRSEKFMETGSVHLLAISGLHVGIVALVLNVLLRLTLVPRKTALLMVVLVVVAYTVLTGARPPAVRAAILVAAFCAAQSMGRRSLPFNSLAAAGLVVLALNPADLFRTGVHLSFIAVAGLMWFAPTWFVGGNRPDGWQKLVAESRGWLSRSLFVLGRSARHLTIVSVMIWLLTMPLVMARFHLLTPVSVVLNTLFWIPVTVALASGLGVLTFGWLLPPVAALFGRCCDGSLWLLELCIEQAHRAPASHLWVPGPADWWLTGFYGSLAVLAAIPSIRLPRRWCLTILLAWTAVGFAWPMIREEGPRLDCTFLSVGHGAAVVLELPSGQTVLYDAGQFSSPHSGARTIAGFLWSRGITHVDTIVLSHPDLDHYNALPELLDRFSVGEIRVPPGMFSEESWALEALLQAIRRSGTPLREISIDDHLDGGADCRIEVLHPPPGVVVGSDNANSVTLGIDYQGRRILLPGDLEGSGLSDVLAQSPWHCDVLLVPHHGSRRSNPPGLAAWCTPETVVVSGSDEYDLTETLSAYQAAGATVWHTWRRGAVRVRIEKGTIGVTGFLSPEH